MNSLFVLSLLLGSASQTSSTPKASDSSTRWSSIGHFTTARPIANHLSHAPPIPTSARRSASELIKPVSKESSILADKGDRSGAGVEGIATDSVLLRMLANVKPVLDAGIQYNDNHETRTKTSVLSNETMRIIQEAFTSQSTRTEEILKETLDNVLAEGTVKRSVTHNAGPISARLSSPGASEEKSKRQLQEFIAAMAKDPLTPCSTTANQELLNSSTIFRFLSDEAGNGYEFKYYAPQESFRHEVGVLKNVVSGVPVLEVRGYYVWYLYKTDSLFPLRYTYVTHYVANELGFQVEGEHIPGSQGRVPNKLPFDKVPCSEEQNRLGEPTLMLPEALITG